MATYETMDVSDLGDNTNVADLAAFRRACRLRHGTEDETKQETTEWMWGNGDWMARARAYVTYDADAVDAADEVERIEDGERDAPTPVTFDA